jgi:hypothetical protein
MERGVKGMLPLGCLPRWGREGVTLIASSKCKKNMSSKRISTEQKNLISGFTADRPVPVGVPEMK